MTNSATKTLDLGCGPAPRNPFYADEVYGVASVPLGHRIRAADLVIEPIPFESGLFDYVSAFDVIAQIPRLIYAPQRRHPFVELMNEIWRVLKPGGLFLALTPAYPHAAAFQNPVNVNIITEETFPHYFGNEQRQATLHGFAGAFQVVSQEWRGMHLLSILRKLQHAALPDSAAQSMAQPAAPALVFAPSQNIAKDLESALNLQNSGDSTGASRIFHQVLAADPRNVVALYSLAVIAMQASQPDEALALMNRCVAANDKFAQGWYARAHALQALGQLDEALKSYEQAITVNPSYTEAMINKGALLRELHRHHEALTSFHRALQIDPANINALSNYGVMLSEYKQHKEAIGVFEQLIKAKPDYDFALGSLLHEQMQICEWKDFARLKQEIATGIEAGRKTCKTLALMAIADSAELQYECGRLFADQRYPAAQQPLAQASYRHERLRIGYVSPDFRNHPVGQLIAGIFEAHDHERFEIHAFSIGIDDGSERRKRLIAACDRFHDVKSWSAGDIARLIREQEIDILVDLAGYTSDSRTQVFAYRPAPIQINYLGYPGTMALPYYDYILADPYVVPPESEKNFSEQVIRVRHSYLPTDAGLIAERPTPPRSQYGLPENGVIFCSFNHQYKINPEVFDVWMRILKRVPGSILWLMSSNEQAGENLRKEAAARGVAPERLHFATRVPSLDDHLARYQLADLFLDTFPYNAHTTATDALLSGLPIVTLQGKAFAARVAASLLHAIDVPELITHTKEEYETLAVTLASTPEKIQALKRKILRNRDTQALFDTQATCRNIEEIYRELQETHQFHRE
jgi:predicted O-linked N-acetylglucosamine transferase (SPINDLY family)